MRTAFLRSLWMVSQHNGSADDLHILHVFVTRLGKLQQNTKLGYLKLEALFLLKTDETPIPEL